MPLGEAVFFFIYIYMSKPLRHHKQDVSGETNVGSYHIQASIALNSGMDRHNDGSATLLRLRTRLDAPWDRWLHRASVLLLDYAWPRNRKGDSRNRT
jgi:hypothetical protein